MVQQDGDDAALRLFGQIVLDSRKKLGYTREVFAERAGCSVDTIKRIEHNRFACSGDKLYDPRYRVVCGICAVIGLPYCRLHTQPDDESVTVLNQIAELCNGYFHNKK
jgi:transcriptional regulator with XRE-family HTH domain